LIGEIAKDHDYFGVYSQRRNIQTLISFYGDANIWRSEAIIILQLRFDDILTAKSILKIVSSYILFVMSILISLVHNMNIVMS
jgi:hypothetical protein